METNDDMILKITKLEETIVKLKEDNLELMERRIAENSQVRIEKELIKKIQLGRFFSDSSFRWNGQFIDQ